MVQESKLYYPSVSPVIEAMGTTAVILHGGGTENFTLDTWGFPCLITNVKVVSQGGGANPFLFSIFEATARGINDLVYRQSAANVRIDDNLMKELPFRASVQNSNPSWGTNANQRPFYCTITNNDPANDVAFFVQIRYRVQGGPVENDVSGTIPNTLGALTDNV